MKNLRNQANCDNLKFVAEYLAGIPHFCFFGTLLGVARNGVPIPDDDDVDVLVDSRYRKNVMQVLANSDLGFVLEADNPVNQTDYFLNYRRLVNGVWSQLDFYFYENIESRNYLIERWNFGGFHQVNNPSNALHIPKNIVFPVKRFFIPDIGYVNIPNKEEDCSAWLYGDKWRTPSAKGKDYLMVVQGHRPKLIQISFLYKMIRGLGSVLPYKVSVYFKRLIINVFW
ncbi:LicD family protein [Alphaproteobacteria bacterium]|nr:LicD family protein [Alphaproteobacteria bacterium]